MNNFILNYNDLVEIYDDDLYSNLENISYSTDSMNNRVEICRCKKFQKQDPQFIVFKVQIKMDGDHYYMLQGSIDLFKSVFPNGEVGNPFLSNFNKVDIEKFLNSLSDATINNESESISRLVEKFKITEDKAKEIYHGYCGNKEFSDTSKKDFMNPLVGAAVAGAASGLVKSIVGKDFADRLRKCNFAYSNMTSRVLKIKFDPAVLKLNNLNRFLDTFKMLPIVSEVKKEDDTIVLLINTDESEVGVSEIINAALAKVASNVTYQITEEDK